METKIIKVRSDNDIINAAKMIRNGDIVAFPTETVYGIGANGLNFDARKKIYEVKSRPPDKPLTLHVANRKMIDKIAIVSSLADKLIKKFLPGPLTLILPKTEFVPNFAASKNMSIGIRMPNNNIALKLIEFADCPIAAPSANLSGQESPTNAQMVYDNLKGRIPLILDDGICTFSMDSTIIDLTTAQPQIIREGAISKSVIYDFINKSSGGFI